MGTTLGGKLRLTPPKYGVCCIPTYIYVRTLHCIPKDLHRRTFIPASKYVDKAPPPTVYWSSVWAYCSLASVTEQPTLGGGYWTRGPDSNPNWKLALATGSSAFPASWLKEKPALRDSASSVEYSLHLWQHGSEVADLCVCGGEGGYNGRKVLMKN